MADTAELDTIKVGLEILSLISTAIIAYVGLKIRTLIVQTKLDQANNKAELIRHQQDIKDTLQKDTQKIAQDVFAIDIQLASHTVQDTERFASMGKSMDRQDTVLDRIEKKIDRNYDTRADIKKHRSSDNTE